MKKYILPAIGVFLVIVFVCLCVHGDIDAVSLIWGFGIGVSFCAGVIHFMAIRSQRLVDEAAEELENKIDEVNKILQFLTQVDNSVEKKRMQDALKN